MKIRNDFVSNSSSSSFIVINDTNKIYPDVQDYHTEYDPLMLPTDEYGGECCFGWEFEKYRSFWSKLNWCAILITQMEMYLNMSEEDKKWYVPFVIEPSIGVDRAFLAIMTEAYTEETLPNGETRIAYQCHV